jgi:AcrR family transcriptional regulator
MAARAYRPPRRSTRADATRQKITAAVHELLDEGTFHEATVEEVADRAGVSRATVYLHFRSRFDLIDAICDTFADNDALRRAKASIDLPDVDQALAATLENSVRFWASEDAVLAELYGVVAVDPAAQSFVDRQRADRRRELKRLAHRLHAGKRLRRGVGERRALAQLMVLTSYESFRELRREGLREREVVAALQESAGALLRSP